MTELQKLMDKYGYTPYKLSQLSSVRFSTINKYLEQDTMYYYDGSLEVYWKLAQVFDVDPETIMLGDNWWHALDICRTSTTLSNAVEHTAKALNTSVLDIHNKIREFVGIDTCQLLSHYERYRCIPKAKRALDLATFLNYSINAIWGDYFREKNNAG